MVCSEKELGISEEHEGIIILDDDALLWACRLPITSAM